MQTIGQIIGVKKENPGLLLCCMASYRNINQAILNKIEHNECKASNDNNIQLAKLFAFDQEGLLIQSMSEKIAYEIAAEGCAGKVLRQLSQKLNFLNPNP